MKAVYLAVVLLLLVSISIVTAQDDTGGGKTDVDTGTQITQNLKNSGVNVAGIPANGNGYSLSGGILTTPSGTQIDTSTMSGQTIFINGNQITVNGVTITGADSISMQNGQLVVTGGTIITTGNQPVSAPSASTFQAGPIVITNGQNIIYQNGCISATSADSLVHVDTVATQLNTLTYCSNTLNVQTADSVWAGCVYMENVEDATITAGTQVVIQGQDTSNFSLKDCASNQLNFDALSDNATVTITKETVSPTYVLEDTLLTLDRANGSESIETNGTATAEIHRQNGVEKVIMTPVTIYTYDTKDQLRDFSIRAWQDGHTIYLKKMMTQVLPAEAGSCKDCTIVDLPNHRIDIRGVIDLNKAQVNRMGKSAGLSAFFTTGNKNAKASLLFDQDNAIVNELTILADAAPYKTYVSNYLAISESVQTNNRTERLLGVNEKILKNDLSTSLVKSYKTVYSNATTLIDNNQLTYQREGTNLIVLPDGHVQISEIVDKLKMKRAFLLLPLLGFLLPLRRRGQLTIFILLGVIMMIIVGLMLYTVGIVSLPGERIKVTERQQVQDFATQCLAIAGKDSLDVFGVHGGYIMLPPPFFNAPATAYLYSNGNANLLPLDKAELSVATETKTRFLRCVDGFKTLSGVTVEVQKEPEIKSTFGARDTTFRMNYAFQVRKGDERWDFDEFGITMEVPALNNYLVANATVQSQLQNDGQINLDIMPSTKMTLFPLLQTLMSFQETFVGRQLEPYYFFFANQR